MSGIISGKVRLDVQRVSAEAALRAAVETMTPAANAKGITIETAMDPLAGPVMGDAARLQQVFWNLLSNAIKFTPAGGRASVSLNRVGGHIEISVADTGEGIPPAFLPHVFDRFRQSDASITRRHGGLGLGLAIVKQLVELHGGSIRARSDGEGHGATFIVSLPVASPDRPEPAAAGSHPPTAQGDESAAGADHCGQLSGVKVLVVDDEPDALALVTRLLEHCDARVTTATTAAEAMEKLQLEQPDVLVSDVGMPNEDGYAFIRRVRLLPRERGGAVPAIALTAYARAEDRMKAIRAGFQMHVPKPVEPAELITMVASLAGRSGG
jgi:CheY-like chemotaxis protein